MKHTIKHISEKILRPRLRILAYILLFLAICSLAYAIIKPYPSVEPEGPLLPLSFSHTDDLLEVPELVPHELLNFFVVAFVFFFLSLVCFFESLKRKNKD